MRLFFRSVLYLAAFIVPILLMGAVGIISLRAHRDAPPAR